MQTVFLFWFFVIVVSIFLCKDKIIISWSSVVVCLVVIKGCFFLFMKYVKILFMLPWMPIIFMAAVLMLGACCTLFVAYVLKKIV